MGRPVQVIGVPADFGANRRGVDMGPSAIRYAGLADQLTSAAVEPTDAGDLLVSRMEEPTADAGPGSAKFLDEIEGLCTRLTEEVAAAIESGKFPLVLGGDHSIAIGTLAGSARDAAIGAIWFDAHGDFNTPATSASGNVHGMPLAAALGRGAFADMPWAQATGLQEENLVWVGLRNLDDAERETIRASDATAYTMSDIDERGVGPVVDEAVDVAADGVDGLHVSLDLDWVDPDEAPGVGTPVRGGVTYREAHTAMEVVARKATEAGALRSMDVVEVNPILDTENRTASLAAELAASGLGKRIL
ncbi:MAG: arginase [Halodesulfurarchaeum sp.]